MLLIFIRYVPIIMSLDVAAEGHTLIDTPNIWLFWYNNHYLACKNLKTRKFLIKCRICII